MILNQTYGFTGDKALVAPQANAMAAVIDPLMSGTSAPWLLYGIGAVLSIILTFLRIPALAFALGMFIPLDLNVPLLIGGAVAWFVSTRSRNAEINKARLDKGTLLASGFIAGGALMGVVSVALQYFEIHLLNEAWLETAGSQWVALVAYTGLIAYLIWDSMRTDQSR